MIILDAGTGLISLGNELMQKYIESGTTITDRTPVKCSILLSHIHLDHIQGFPFFRPSHLASTRMALLGGVNYNETLEFCDKLEKQGKAIIIRPEYKYVFRA